ncbi:MAG TPA: hypothetical protein PKA64_18305, partial [Myxococcota bacterium]|nr:hypothetical protein [Myxococcota bacterium]
MLLLVLFQACFLLDWAEPTVTWDTAVAPASDRWLPRSAVWAAPAGRFAPLADGGWIGLSAMVCAVDWSTGQIGADTEIEPDQVEVITDYDASRVVVITPHGAHAWRPTDGADEAHPTDAAPLDARLTDDGVVVLLDDPAGCAIAWGDARADAP